MLLIKEFLPDPVGSDTDAEYITIVNRGEEAVDLTGMKIADLTGKSFNLLGVLSPNEEIQVFSKVTKIRLNNSGEVVFLYNSLGEEIDQLSYSGKAIPGKPIVRHSELAPREQLGFFDESAVTGRSLVSGNYLAANTLSVFTGGIVFLGVAMAIAVSVLAFLVTREEGIKT